MTPQETQLVSELFDRLASLESTPRDAQAERLIADGLRRAPHAVYALVQTALVQDEALKRANARIEELQAQVGAAPEAEQQPASFLDTMREAFTGRAPARSSVPSVRAAAPGAPLQGRQPPEYPPQMPPPGYPGNPPSGSGSSFLGTAASAAAGMIGGALLLDGIRSMFGHHHNYGPSAFGSVPANASPWSGDGTQNDLGHKLGNDDIGHHAYDTEHDQTADTDFAMNTNEDTDDQYDADDDFGSDSDSGDDSYDA